MFRDRPGRLISPGRFAPAAANYTIAVTLRAPAISTLASTRGYTRHPGLTGPGVFAPLIHLFRDVTHSLAFARQCFHRDGEVDMFKVSYCSEVSQ